MMMDMEQITDGDQGIKSAAYIIGMSHKGMFFMKDNKELLYSTGLSLLAVLKTQCRILLCTTLHRLTSKSPLFFIFLTNT